MSCPMSQKNFSLRFLYRQSKYVRDRNLQIFYEHWALTLNYYTTFESLIVSRMSFAKHRFLNHIKLA